MKLYIDGASRGNPGECAIGFVLYDDADREIYRFGKKIGYHTNNFAEYSALIEALNYLIAHMSSVQNGDKIQVYSDSQLIVNQLNGGYKVKSSSIEPLFRQVQRLRGNIKNMQIIHTSRKNNRIADWVANRALDEKPYDKSHEKLYRPADRSQEGSLLRKVRAPKGHGAG